jgi:hypothetical protein
MINTYASVAAKRQTGLSCHRRDKDDHASGGQHPRWDQSSPCNGAVTAAAERSRHAAITHRPHEHTAGGLLRERAAAGQFQQPTPLSLDPLDVLPSDTLRPRLGGLAHPATRSAPGRANNLTCGQLRLSNAIRQRRARWRSSQKAQHRSVVSITGRAKLVSPVARRGQFRHPWTVARSS